MRIAIWPAIVALLACTIGLSWVQAPKAIACSCVISTPTEQAGWAELVASGTLTNVSEPVNAASSSDPVTFTVELDRIWKGSPEGTVTVETPSSSASCGLDAMAKGMRIILFASHTNLMGEPIPGWGANLCGGTGPVDEQIADELTALLGQPATPPPTDPAQQGNAIGLLPPLTLIAAAALLAGGWAHWRFRPAAA